MKKIILISALLIIGYSIFAQRVETKQGNWTFTGYIEGQDSIQTPIAKMDIIKANTAWAVFVYDTLVLGNNSPATRQRFNVDGAIQIGTTTTGTAGAIRYTGSAFEGYTTSWGALGGGVDSTLLWTNYNEATKDTLSLASGNIDAGGDWDFQGDINADDYMIDDYTVIDSKDTSNLYIGNAGNTTMTGLWNHFIGNQAGILNTTGYGNVGMGSRSLYKNTSGYSNVAIGDSALYNSTTGYRNFAIGYNALSNNVTGYNNVAVGVRAGEDQTGSGGVFLGYYAGGNQTGAGNISIGNQGGTGAAGSTGTENVFIGSATGFANTTASFGVGIGYQALNDNTTAAHNIAIGTQSLTKATTGGSNIAIGREAGEGITTGTKNIFIGYECGEGWGNTSNILAIDNNDDANPFIYGDMAADTLRINGSLACDSIYTTKAAAWADFVFNKGYDLPTLDEQGEFIHKKKHLPSLQPDNPKQKRVTDGDIQRRLEGLVEEVEKAYLYIIELEKRIKKLEKE